MKKFLRKHRYGLVIIIPGAFLGFLYWYYIGCNTGTCPITSVWYNSAIYGAILGYFAGDLIDSRKRKKESVQAQSGQMSE